MAGEWRRTKLGDVVEINPEALGSDWPYDHIRYVDISSVGEGFLIELPRHLSITDAPSRAKRLVRSGDTILSTVRPNRRSMYFVKESSPDLVVSTGFAVLRPRENLIEPRYLYACVFDKNFTEYLVSREKGAAYPAVLPEDIADAVINLPPLPEQRAIAAVLGALDDKIELNRRMNRTLEAIAQAVFREMMKDVEEEGSILEFADLLSGGTPSTAEESYWNGDIEWVSAKDVSSADGVFLLDTEKKITQAGIDHSSTKLLPAKTTIVTARGTVGAHCMLGKPMTMNQTNYGLKAKEGIGDYFVYFALSEMIDQLKQQSYGTIFDTITTKTFHSVLCPRPSLGVIQQFEERVTPLMDAILNNLKQSRTLAALRDALLPKLMRGEVRVTVHE